MYATVSNYHEIKIKFLIKLKLKYHEPNIHIFQHEPWVQLGKILHVKALNLNGSMHCGPVYQLFTFITLTE